MSAIKPVEVNFPGRTFYLVPETNIVKKYGFYFPREIEQKTLFVTGISGTGKSYTAKEICKQEQVKYDRQSNIILQETPKLWRAPIKFNSISDLATNKVVDGHFLFDFPGIGKREAYYAHDPAICNLDYSNLELKGNFNADIFGNKFIFEFRQFAPDLINFMRMNREKNTTVPIGWGYPDFKYQSDEIINKAEYLLYQTAYKLFEKSSDVYVRLSPHGKPYRFLNADSPQKI